MSIKPPFTDLEIERAPSGFYEGYSLPIALISKSVMVALVLWALIFPLSANDVLSSINWSLLEGFNTFYIISVGLFFFFVIIVALVPSVGKRVLGKPGEKPEFSTFILVLNDVWCGSWCWSDGLRHRRTDGALGFEP